MFRRRNRTVAENVREVPSDPLPLVLRDDGPPISPLAMWPSPPPPGYCGQLRDEFQAALKEERVGVNREKCRFYHSMDLPDGDVIHAPWDLRGKESAYLGNVDLAGQRVLELGPATGGLTFWMERQGAEVVCVDAGFDVSIDLLPESTGNTRQLLFDHFRMVSDFQNAWWYLQKRLDSRAKMVYGNVYQLPQDIGEFDVAIFGAILLHLRSPIQALQQAASRARTIIVTDAWSGGNETLRDNIMRPFPIGEAGRWVIWWEISAGAVISMLEILGYTCVLTEHKQLHQPGHVDGAPYLEIPMYTVVGTKN